MNEIVGRREWLSGREDWRRGEINRVFSLSSCQLKVGCLEISVGESTAETAWVTGMLGEAGLTGGLRRVQSKATRWRVMRPYQKERRKPLPAKVCRE